MSEEKKSSWQDHVLNTSTWMRGGFMLLFVLINYIARLLIWLLSALQFLIMLVRGSTHDKLTDLGESISLYSYHIMLFLTFNMDEKPYPFSEWPEHESQIDPKPIRDIKEASSAVGKDNKTSAAV